jgi:serine phosphatase RsbU (regulator of sigma subunit)
MGYSNPAYEIGGDAFDYSLNRGTAHVAVRHVHGGDVFVTGQLLELDLSQHLLRWINAGHPDPLHLRGGRVLAEPHVEPLVPFGLGGPVGDTGELSIEPGDSLLLFSDGAPEARPDGGDQFGRVRLVDAVHRLLAIETTTPPQLLRGLIEAVRAHRLADLEDDVTFVLVSVDES